MHPYKQSNRHAPPPDLFRDRPTFGELYPYFKGSRRERRKPRRIDLILSADADAWSLQLEQAWLVGDSPLSVKKRVKTPKGPLKGGEGTERRRQPVVKTKTVNLRCQEGKGGYLCEQKGVANRS